MKWQTIVVLVGVVLAIVAFWGDLSDALCPPSSLVRSNQGPRTAVAFEGDLSACTYCDQRALWSYTRLAEKEPRYSPRAYRALVCDQHKEGEARSAAANGYAVEVECLFPR